MHLYILGPFELLQPDAGIFQPAELRVESLEPGAHPVRIKGEHLFEVFSHRLGAHRALGQIESGVLAGRVSGRGQDGNVHHGVVVEEHGAVFHDILELHFGLCRFNVLISSRFLNYVFQWEFAVSEKLHPVEEPLYPPAQGGEPQVERVPHAVPVVDRPPLAPALDYVSHGVYGGQGDRLQQEGPELAAVGGGGEKAVPQPERNCDSVNMGRRFMCV